MKKKVLLFFGVLLISTFGFGQSAAEKAKEIVRKAQNLTLGINSSSTMSMQIIRPEWSRTITMQSWSMGTEYYLIYITAPARDKGQIFLKRENNMWNWMPSIGRTIKIPPSMLMSSWMGSDLNNDELMKESSLIVDYSHELISEETVEDYLCYKIELTPLPQAPVVWNKVVMWISKEHDFALKVEFFGKNDELVNRQLSSDIKNMDGRLIPTKIIMEPVQKPGQQTVLIIEKLKFNDPKINASMFSLQNMKQIRPN